MSENNMSTSTVQALQTIVGNGEEADALMYLSRIVYEEDTKRRNRINELEHRIKVINKLNEAKDKDEAIRCMCEDD